MRLAKPSLVPGFVKKNLRAQTICEVIFHMAIDFFVL